MILLRLFWEFFKTGLFSVGGGMATLPFLYSMSENTGWFTASQLADMVAVSESTPGPIGVNMATYVGFTTAGVPGAVIATLGLITPEIIIILIIAEFLEKFRSNKYVDSSFYGLRACSVGLIAAACLLVVKISLISWQAIAMAAVILVLTRFVPKIKDFHPIVFIALSAVAGMLFLSGCTIQRTPEPEPVSTEPIVIVTPEPTPDTRPDDYERAEDLLYTRHFDEAAEIFTALGDYEDSAERAAQALKYKEEETEIQFPIISDENIAKVYEYGKLYYHLYGLIYVPDKVDSETKFMLYHSGGAGEEDYLYYNGLYRYFYDFYPNAVMMFCNNSGYNIIRDKNRVCFSVLTQVAQETGIVVHDLALVGSSQGCFTALWAIPEFYENYGIKVTSLCTLDTGMEWDDPRNLSAEQVSLVKKAGTVLYLFEQPDVGVDKEPIKDFIDAGIETYIVFSQDNHHNQISVDAYNYGVFNFAVNEKNEVNDEHYYFIKLDKDSKPYNEGALPDPWPWPTPTPYNWGE